MKVYQTEQLFYYKKNGEKEQCEHFASDNYIFKTLEDAEEYINKEIGNEKGWHTEATRIEYNAKEIWKKEYNDFDIYWLIYEMEIE